MAATQIEVIRQQTGVSLLESSREEQERQIIHSILNVKNPAARKRLLGFRALLAKLARAPSDAPPDVSSSLAARVLEYSQTVCAVPAAHGGVQVAVERHARGCRANAPATAAEAPPSAGRRGRGRRGRPTKAADASGFQMGRYSAPIAVDGVVCDWARFADPYAGEGAGAPARVPARHAETVPANAVALRGLLRRLEAGRFWANSRLRNGSAVISAAPTDGGDGGDAAIAPAAAPAAAPAPLHRTAPFTADGLDIARALDWKHILPADAADDVARLLAFPIMRWLAPVLYAEGPTGETLRALLQTYDADAAAARAQEDRARDDAAAAAKTRTLMDILAKTAPAVAAAVAKDVRAGRVGVPTTPSALQTVLAERGAAVAWKKIAHKDAEETDYWRARAGNKCRHVALYRVARAATSMLDRRRALGALVETLEQGYRDVRDRWIRCGTCKFPAVCPHALRDLGLVVQGADEQTRRRAMAPFEERPNGHNGDDGSGGNGGEAGDGGDGGAEHACKVCGEILFYSVEESRMSERITRANLPDAIGTAVRRELLLAAGNVQSATGGFSTQQVVLVGEAPVGKLYAAAVGAFQRDRVASDATLAARAAAALGIYVYAFLASLVVGTPGLSIESEGGARKKPANKGGAQRPMQVVDAALRLYAHRYSIQAASLANTRDTLALATAAVAAGTADRPVPQPGPARPARGDARADAQVLRQQFISAYQAIGAVRGTVQTTTPRDEFVAGMLTTPQFKLVLRARAATDPAGFRTVLAANKKRTTTGASAALFVFALGAPPETFLPVKNRRAAVVLWTGYSIAWVPAHPDWDWMRYVWARVASGPRREPWTDAAVADLRRQFRLDPTGRADAVAGTVVANTVYVGLRVMAGPSLHTARMLPAPMNAVFTADGSRRRYVHVNYGAQIVGDGDGAATDWAAVSDADYRHARVVDQTGARLGRPVRPDQAADAAAASAYGEMSRRRGFFTVYLVRCPDGGMHEWGGTAPAPPRCTKCGILQADLYAAFTAANNTTPMHARALAYFRKHEADAPLTGARVADAPELSSVLSGLMRLRVAAAGPDLAAALSRSLGLATRLGGISGHGTNELALLGAYTGMTAPEIKKKFARQKPGLYAAGAVRSFVLMFVRHWEVLRGIKNVTVAAKWLADVGASAHVAMTDLPPDVVAALRALPRLDQYPELSAGVVPASPVRDFRTGWAFARVAHAKTPDRLYGYALETFAGLCLWAWALAETATPETQAVLAAFVRCEVAAAVRFSSYLLHPTGPTEIRMYVARTARITAADDGDAQNTDDLAGVADADADIAEMGAGVVTAEDVFDGDSDYTGQNEENSDNRDEK